jgi:pilus assembly protein CpaF
MGNENTSLLRDRLGRSEFGTTGTNVSEFEISGASEFESPGMSEFERPGPDASGFNTMSGSEADKLDAPKLHESTNESEDEFSKSKDGAVYDPQRTLFDIERYLSGMHGAGANETRKTAGEYDFFADVCGITKKALDDLEKEAKGHELTILERQAKAILGHKREAEYYKEQIREILASNELSDTPCPPWYKDLTEAVYGELLGFAGLTEWIEGRTKSLAESSSAKVIGDRVYFLIGGRLKLMPQTISKERRNQLRTALLLGTPEKRSKDVYHEVYLLNGTRVTIYNEGLVKKGQDCIVFRKFLVNNYTFEEQTARHTIPEGSAELFKNMVKIGFNVAFIGPVRTAKTTFLTTWQRYEDDTLEGVMIESDPEIPLHTIMPTAPILQFVPSEEDFGKVIKRTMRSDADYIIMAEARDGEALNTAVGAANKGTRRVKITFHTSDATDFCYDAAEEIRKACGGDLGSTIVKVAKSFQYLFRFIQLSGDKSQKRLKDIWEIRYNGKLREIRMYRICGYDHRTDSWAWANTVGDDKEEFAVEEDLDAFLNFKRILAELSETSPLTEDIEFIPYCDDLIGNKQNNRERGKTLSVTQG